MAVGTHLIALLQLLLQEFDFEFARAQLILEPRRL